MNNKSESIEANVDDDPSFQGSEETGLTDYTQVASYAFPDKPPASKQDKTKAAPEADKEADPENPSLGRKILGLLGQKK